MDVTQPTQEPAVPTSTIASPRTRPAPPPSPRRQQGVSLALALLALAPPLAAANLVADLNTGGIASVGFQVLAEDAAVLDDRLYVFAANDGFTGSEPWALDLDTGELARLGDLFPGPSSSQPRDFVAIGTAVLFVATSPTAGEELWATDGTAVGTELVADIAPGPNSSALSGLYPVPGDRAVFAANNGADGSEPWVSDGTPGGTSLLADIAPGAAGSFPTSFTLVGGELLFAAEEATSGRELWKWSAGAVSLVRDLQPGAGGSNPSSLYPIPATGIAVFSACTSSDGCELWRSNGTSAGTFLLADLNPSGSSSPSTFLWHTGLSRLFFSATDGTHGQELWEWQAGVATRLTDLASGANDASPKGLGELASKLVFTARDANPGTRLFAYDGTTVSQLKSLSTSGVPNSPRHTVEWNNRVYFYESGGGWSTDGTPAGTVKWGTVLSEPAFAIGGGRLLHGRIVAGERELWSIDPSDVSATETAFASLSSDPRDFTWRGDLAFFSADDGVAGRELWTTRGSAADTERLDLEPGPAGSTPEELTPFAGAIWFVATTSATGRELWHSDGTPGGTVAYELAAGADGSQPSELAVVGEQLFTVANLGTLGRQLVRISDPGSPFTVLAYASNVDFSPDQLTPSGPRLFLLADASDTGYELFVVQAGASAPVPLEIVPGPDSPSRLESLVAWNGEVFFVADDGVTGSQIWRSNGTTVQRVTNLTSGWTPSDLTAGPGGIYFVYDEPVSGNELWRTDGTTTQRITDLAPAGGDSYPRQLTAVGSRLYFVATDGVVGYEPWWTDGTATQLVGDLAPGTASSQPDQLTAAGSLVVFAADDGTHGRELWLADSEGAQRLPEPWPEIASSTPLAVAVDPTASRILFSAFGPTTWREPFRLDFVVFADGFESGAPDWSESP
jgi:ELWxxDGT repeat protein